MHNKMVEKSKIRTVKITQLYLPHNGSLA